MGPGQAENQLKWSNQSKATLKSSKFQTLKLASHTNVSLKPLMNTGPVSYGISSFHNG